MEEDYTLMQYNAAMRENETNQGGRSLRAELTVCLLVFLIFSSVACERASSSIAYDPVTAETVTPREEDWLQVYFSEPEAGYAASYRGGPDAILADAIWAARVTVEAAIYNMNLWSIRDALLAAHARGVIVRVVTDSDNIDGEEFQELIEAGIPVLGDRHEGSMHNKFVVIDRVEVWTGSMNFTLNGAYEDNNNIVSIRSAEVAENYLVEFNEMFVNDLFSSESPSDTPYPEVTIGEMVVETYFSPEDNVQNRLMEVILGAEESIRFMAYSFTADVLGDAIREMALRGVSVAGVMESEQALSNAGTEFDPFRQAALDVRLDGNEGQMHHKVIIIDNKIVITGSYNFSRNAAEINDENVIIIHSPRLAGEFSNEFLKMLKEATLP